MKCLLIYPNPESALNEEAGRLLLEQYSEYSKQAKMMTEIYAQSKSTASSTSKQKEEEGDCATSSKDTIVNTKINTGCKKRAGDKTDKKKQDKKRALKRL